MAEAPPPRLADAAGAFEAPPPLGQWLLATALLLFVATQSGKVFRRVGLPSISGYLLAGLVLGPQVLGWVAKESVRALWLLDDACLALIGIAAGSEVVFDELKPHSVAVAAYTAAITVGTWLAVYPTVLFIAPYVPFLMELNSTRVSAVASILSTLMVARSPASALAVLRDTEGRGPFCTMTLAVVVVKDVVTVLMFSLNLEYVRHAFAEDDAAATSLAALAAPFVHVAWSAALGVAGSVMLAALPFEPSGGAEKSAPPTPTRAPSGRLAPPLSSLPSRLASYASYLAREAARGPRAVPVDRAVRALARPAMLVGIAGGLYVLARRTGGEPLLCCLVAGIGASNAMHSTLRGAVAALRRAARHPANAGVGVVAPAGLFASGGDLEAEGRREEATRHLATLMPAVNVIFFSFAGTSIHLEALVKSAAFAVLIFLARLFALYASTTLTGQLLVRMYPDLASTPVVSKTSSYAWMAYVTQAGVALGLIKLVVAAFPAWGGEFAALGTTTVVINQVVGPPLFKFAIVRSGEAHTSLPSGKSAPAPSESSGPSDDAAAPAGDGLPA